MALLWSLNLQPCPKVVFSERFLFALLGCRCGGHSLFYTVGHISACVSFSKVVVSFTHVINSAEESRGEPHNCCSSFEINRR
ncbi:hypothetical protein CDL15_Pgr000923 [Punica granatum]|uniref:Uncharacterized protein n=1 Tax=Punica granatum TaxID=22663 RepID=A0A218XHS4_PUNGR|nr:hypothetical protein CDL15_Pgr000923 [Punica granatum]